LALDPASAEASAVPIDALSTEASGASFRLVRANPSRSGSAAFPETEISVRRTLRAWRAAGAPRFALDPASAEAFAVPIDALSAEASGASCRLVTGEPVAIRFGGISGNRSSLPFRLSRSRPEPGPWPSLSTPHLPKHRRCRSASFRPKPWWRLPRPVERSSLVRGGPFEPKLSRSLDSRPEEPDGIPF
jgi:hypothetical protein